MKLVGWWGKPTRPGEGVGDHMKARGGSQPAATKPAVEALPAEVVRREAQPAEAEEAQPAEASAQEPATSAGEESVTQ